MHETKFQIETEQEDDDRWIAEIPDIPGVMTYGATQEEAATAVQALALRVLSDQ
jgi:predicted RNase H-like HicB family nuclease